MGGERTAVVAERLFDGKQVTSGGVAVLVEDGKIAGVEHPGAVPDGWTRLDRPGSTIVPGLIDMHVHLCGDNSPQALDRLPDYGPSDFDMVIRSSLEQHRAVGVTTVRDLGDCNYAVVDRRRSGTISIADGLPAVVASGPPITTSRGHCWNMGGEAEIGPGALRRAVRDRAEHGVDVIKIMASGGMLTEGTDVFACQFPDEDMQAAIDEAHRLGLPITAHAHALSAAEQVVRLGVDGVEHFTCLSATGIHPSDDLMTAVRDRGVVVDPTLGVVPGIEPPPRMRAILKQLGIGPESRLKWVGELLHAEVRIVSGSDGGIGPGKPHAILPLALGELVASGATPIQAVASATSAAADACGLGSRKGRIRPGLDADLVVVDGNPTTSIADVQLVRDVMIMGALASPIP